MLFKELKIVLVKYNFLALADIRVFGRTCLFAMLLLIGLTIFYVPCLALLYQDTLHMIYIVPIVIQTCK